MSYEAFFQESEFGFQPWNVLTYPGRTSSRLHGCSMGFTVNVEISLLVEIIQFLKYGH